VSLTPKWWWEWGRWCKEGEDEKEEEKEEEKKGGRGGGGVTPALRTAMVQGNDNAGRVGWGAASRGGCVGAWLTR
jgi:hypothetical protein